MVQSTGEQATEPSCRTQKTHKALVLGADGTLRKGGSHSHRVPVRTTKVRGGGSLTRSESVLSVFPLEHKPHKAKGLVSSVEFICQQAPAEQTHEPPRRGENQNPRRNGPDAKLPGAHGCAWAGPLRGQTCSQCLHLSADPVPFPTASAPTASNAAPSTYNSFSTTSNQDVPPSEY